MPICLSFVVCHMLVIDVMICNMSRNIIDVCMCGSVCLLSIYVST